MNIAITGEGIISAIGNDKEEVLQSLLEQKSGIGEMQYLQSTHHELPVGEVKMSSEEMMDKLGLPFQGKLSRTILMAMLAAEEAMADAEVDWAQFTLVKRCPEEYLPGMTDDVALLWNGGSPLRIVLVSGTTVGSMDVTEQYFPILKEASDEEKWKSLDEEDRRKALDALRYHDGGSSMNLVGASLGLSDQDVITVSTACSSSANALMLGARMIEQGEADIVIAGGSEALSRFHLNGFNSLMILDHEPCRPFDATRAGLNLGEGAAFVVLESEELARRRGVKAHAYLTGWGNACDAFHQTASSENGEGAYLAMTEALKKAQLSPLDIQYVNAHGTGTPNNDQSETVALQRVFGERMPWVSSTKSMTGHTTSASGSIETVISILAMQHHFVPANLGWANVMEKGIVPTMGERNVVLQHVLCNSFGFGGNDTSLVISAYPREEATYGYTPASPIPMSVPGNYVPQDLFDVLSYWGIERVADVFISGTERLEAIRKYVKPLEARRMGKLMKASLLSSLEALEQAGISTPDAIITATEYGCLENSEKLLLQMEEEGEGMLKPTYFMQSTHNTIGSNIAIKTHCHGYNATYTQGGRSLECALKDAIMLLREGKAKNVLVGYHEEGAPLFDALQENLGNPVPTSIHSEAIVLSAKGTISCGEY